MKNHNIQWSFLDTQVFRRGGSGKGLSETLTRLYFNWFYDFSLKMKSKFSLKRKIRCLLQGYSFFNKKNLKWGGKWYLYFILQYNYLDSSFYFLGYIYIYMYIYTYTHIYIIFYWDIFDINITLVYIKSLCRCTSFYAVSAVFKMLVDLFIQWVFIDDVLCARLCVRLFPQFFTLECRIWRS